jgi:MoxR-like ATPase
MFNIVVSYLPEDDEVRVVTQTTGHRRAVAGARADGAEIQEYQQLVRQVIVAEEIARYAVRLFDSSRPGRQADLPFVKDWVKWGAGCARRSR